MTTGIKHQKSNRTLIKYMIYLNAVLFAIIAIYYSMNTIILFGASCLGLLFGYLFGPDLDQQQVTTINETEIPTLIYYQLKRIRVPYAIRNAIKQLLILFNVSFWKLYSRIPHRNYLSHSYGLSTIIRELYFFIIVIGIYMLIFWTIGPLIWASNNLLVLLVFYLNNAIVDANHLRLDNI